MVIDTKRYLEAHNRVLKVMDSVAPVVREYVDEAIADGDIEEDERPATIERAMDYAMIYALRDVMALMVYGLPLEDALRIWSDGKGLPALDLRGECLNAVTEAVEDLHGEEED